MPKIPRAQLPRFEWFPHSTHPKNPPLSTPPEGSDETNRPLHYFVEGRSFGLNQIAVESQSYSQIYQRNEEGDGEFGRYTKNAEFGYWG